jgi:outer membrane protein OmpA-like peptidoglycan-associated protein
MRKPGGPLRKVTVLVATCLSLAACHDPLRAPADLFHDLEGGDIAAQRPPPPGAGLPYPKLGSVPAKPVLPAPAYRNGLQAQLLAERDRTERVAADTPILPLVPPPPPDLPTATVAAPSPGDPQPTAAATLDTAEAPPPKPAPLPLTPPAPSQKVAAAGGPARGTALSIVGAPMDSAGVPDLPAAPPPPATFEGVAAEPLPTPRVLPAEVAPTPVGTQVFFPVGATALPASQTQALKDFLSHRKKQPIEIIGLGEASSDSPDGQAAAVAMALRRAESVASALVAMHVPQSALRLGANAFGRGAVLRLAN